MMTRHANFAACLTTAIFFVVFQAASLPAAIVATGNVSPTDPTTWNTATTGYVGQTLAGGLSVTSGGLSSGTSYIGDGATVNGSATIAGAASTWTCTGGLYLGNYGNGTLDISGGGSVDNSGFFDSYVAYQPGSSGAATVRGAGSSWNCNWELFVGDRGNGTLNVSGGATVSDAFGYMGQNTGSTGVATVDGAGSTWTNGTYLYVGSSGHAALNISGGGRVTSTGLSINSQSTVSIDVGKGSNLNLGGGAIDNEGVVRIVAGATAASNSAYTPVTAGAWSGGGAVQAVGGTWSTATHQFTASAIQPGLSGQPVNVDLADIQRMMIDDTQTGWSVGASFLAKGSSTPLSVTATAVHGAQLSALQSELPSGQSVAGAWQFATSGGYTAGDPAYLSFDVGAGRGAGLDVWHYDGTSWSPYVPADLTYDGTYASFTVTGFSGYAVTSAVPEPATIAMLLVGAVGLLIYAWRRRA